MRDIKIIFIFLVWAFRIPAVAGEPCSFPVAWREVDWFSGVVSQSTILLEYLEDSITQHNVANKSTISLNSAFRCLEGSQSVQWYTYVIQFHTTNNAYCDKGLLGERGNALLRQTDSIPFGDMLSSCPAILSSTPFYKALIRAPFNFTRSACPFTAPPGDSSWQLSFKETDAGFQCENDPQSTATLSGNELTIDSCYTYEPTYEKPYKVTLQCVDYIRGSDIDDRSNHDDVIIFATPSEGGGTAFYCGRYKQEAGNLQLSLYVGDPSYVSCPASDTATSHGTSTVTFTLTARPNVTTGGTSPMTEAVTIRTSGTELHEGTSATSGVPQTTSSVPQTTSGPSVTSEAGSPSLVVPTYLALPQDVPVSREATIAISVVCSIVLLGIVVVIVVMATQKRKLKAGMTIYDDIKVESSLR